MSRLGLVCGRSISAPVLALLLAPPPLNAAVEVVDDAGQTVHLEVPAQRIITLSPHSTELAFAAGAGERIVGTVAFSDFPPQAREIPRIGDASRLDRERLLSLDADLVLAWQSGNRQQDLEWLQSRGIAVYRSEPPTLDAIAENLQEIGRLAGTSDLASDASRRFSRRLARLRDRWNSTRSTKVFYQLWAQPLITVSGRHLVSQVLAVCGGTNVFAGLAPLTPQVTAEAVLRARPEVIVAAADSPHDDPFRRWRTFAQMSAQARPRLVRVPSDLIHRPGPRLLEAAELICRGLHDES